MRENGFLGLLQIIYASVRDGFGVRRAWLVIGIILTILALPMLLVAGVIALVVT